MTFLYYISRYRNYYIQFLFLVCISTIFYAKMPRILFVTNKFPYAPRQYINNQICGLIDAGCDIGILSQYEPHYSEMMYFPELVKYNLLEKTIYGRMTPAQLELFDIFYFQFANEAKAHLEQKFNRIGSKAKVVICFRGGDCTKAIKRNPSIYRKLFSSIAMAFVVCEHFKDILVQNGYPPEKIMIHHSAINIDKFTFNPRLIPESGTINIISVTRLVPMKGLDIAIKAVVKLHETGKRVSYTIVGEGKLKKELQELIYDLHAQNYIFLVGYKTHDEVINMIDDAHICLMPSRTTQNGTQEGIPNSLMEAMAIGLPVIATRHSGIPELITHKKSGLLVEENNCDQIVDAVRFLIKNPKKTSSMLYKARKHVEREHNKNIQNERLIDIFLKLLEQ